jgi:hypothetical protein
LELGELIVGRSHEILQRIDDLSDVARALADMHEIAFKTQVLVKEEKCIRCSRSQGEPHHVMSCTALRAG